MAWFPSHQSLARHPKTHRLMARLKTSRAETLGHLNLFWWWCLDYAPDGALTGFSAEEVAIAMEWDGDCATLLDALIFAGFIDQTEAGLVVHDWDEYGGKIERRKTAHRERMRESRAGYSTGTDTEVSSGDAHVQRTDESRDAHVRTQIREEKMREEKNPPNPPEGVVSDPDFDTFYDAYPRHEGKEAARKAWRKLKPSASLIETIHADVARRLATGVWVKGSQFIPMPGPYLNGKRWTDELPAANAAPKVDDKVAAAIAERERLLLGQWDGQREALMYAPKSDGPGNVARRIAELDRIITGQVAA